jgi:hypothetical protein
MNDEDDEEPNAGSAQEPGESHSGTRGVGWLLVPSLLGAILGAGLGVVFQPTQPALEALRNGALIGLVLGAALGGVAWAFFPYRGKHYPVDDEEGS